MQPKKKIYLLVFAGIGEGKNRAIYQRARQLALHYDVTVFSARGQTVVEEIAQLAAVVSIAVPKPFSRGIFSKLFCTLMIVFRLFREKELILYTFHRNGFSCGGILKLLRNKKVIWFADMQHTPYYFWDSSALSHLSPLKRLYNRSTGLVYILTAKLFLPKADQVFAMSYDYGEGFAKIMEYDFGVPRRKLFPIPNGVDIALVDESLRSDVELPFALPQGRHKLLYAGNMRLERLRLILDLLKELEKNRTPAVVMACGRMNPAGERFIQRQARNKIVYLGFLPHHLLLALYRHVDVCLIIIDESMRDHLYSHPGKLFEAMAMGKPVVVSNLKSVRQVVKHNENGVIVKNNQLAQAAQRLSRVLSSAETKNRMARNARSAIRILDWKDLNTKWLAQVINITT